MKQQVGEPYGSDRQIMHQSLATAILLANLLVSGKAQDKISSISVSFQQADCLVPLPSEEVRLHITAHSSRS